MKILYKFRDRIFRGMDRFPTDFWFGFGILTNVAAVVNSTILVIDENPMWLLFVVLGSLNAWCAYEMAVRWKAHKKEMADMSRLHIPAFIFETLYNRDWLTPKTQSAIRELFPETWTHLDNLDVSALVNGLRGLGMPINSTDDFHATINGFEMLRLMLRNDALIKRNNVELLIVVSNMEAP